MICVLEKPREYTPMRKCKACQETFELAAFQATGEGYACPWCREVQHVSPYKPKSPKLPEFYRVLATRTQDRLEQSGYQILQIAERMQNMRESGPDAEAPHWSNCVVNKYRRRCEFFEPHAAGRLAGADTGFVTIDPIKYVGLPEEVQEAA